MRGCNRSRRTGYNGCATKSNPAREAPGAFAEKVRLRCVRRSCGRLDVYRGFWRRMRSAQAADARPSCTRCLHGIGQRSAAGREVRGAGIMLGKRVPRVGDSKEHDQSFAKRVQHLGNGRQPCAGVCVVDRKPGTADVGDFEDRAGGEVAAVPGVPCDQRA